MNVPFALMLILAIAQCKSNNHKLTGYHLMIKKRAYGFVQEDGSFRWGDSKYPIEFLTACRKENPDVPDTKYLREEKHPVGTKQ